MTRYYTREHEWIDVGHDHGTIGITEFAQRQLGDITFVELPEPGRAVKAGEGVAVVDSVKAAADAYAPVSGTIIEANPALADAPELVNTDPEGAGWLARLTLADTAELGGLMDRAAYDAYVAGL